MPQKQWRSWVLPNCALEREARLKPRVGREEHPPDPLLGRPGLGERPPRPHGGLVVHERIVPEDERLRGDVRDAPPPHRGEGLREVEREEHRREEVPPHRKIEAPASRTIEGTVLGFPAPILESVQVDGNGRPVHPEVEPARPPNGRCDSQ